MVAKVIGSSLCWVYLAGGFGKGALLEENGADVGPLRTMTRPQMTNVNKVVRNNARLGTVPRGGFQYGFVNSPV
jgi:hypothetical protein